MSASWSVKAELTTRENELLASLATQFKPPSIIPPQPKPHAIPTVSMPIQQEPSAKAAPSPESLAADCLQVLDQTEQLSQQNLDLLA